MQVYLAGALTTHWIDKKWHIATAWRDELIEFFKDNGISYFNPADTYENPKNHTYDGSLIVKQNDYYLNQCDILIVNLDYINESPGTLYELFLANKLYEKPVIALTTVDLPSSPHILHCIDHTCESVEEVQEVLTNMFCQNNF
jgi:nucleoside 2-deoxyribosyltransferase